MPKKHQREDCCPTVVEEPIKLPELNETAEEAAHALPRSEPKHKRARKSRKADASDSPKINAQSEGEQCEKSIVEPDEEVNGSAHSSPTSPEAAVPAKEEKRKSLKVPRKEQKEEKGPMTNLQSSAAKEQLCFYCRQVGNSPSNSVQLCTCCSQGTQWLNAAFAQNRWVKADQTKERRPRASFSDVLTVDRGLCCASLFANPPSCTVATPFTHARYLKRKVSYLSLMWAFICCFMKVGRALQHVLFASKRAI